MLHLDSNIVRYGHCFKCVYQKQWHLVQASSKLECKSLNVEKKITTVLLMLKFKISSLIQNLVKHLLVYLSDIWY